MAALTVPAGFVALMILLSGMSGDEQAAPDWLAWPAAVTLFILCPWILFAGCVLIAAGLIWWGSIDWGLSHEGRRTRGVVKIAFGLLGVVVVLVVLLPRVLDMTRVLSDTI
jgi:hypothetical protein